MFKKEMKKLISILLLLGFSLVLYSQTEPILKIGLIADPQYQDTPSVGDRFYRESLWKLEEAIDTMNYYQVNLIQNLGDIINAEWRSFDSIIRVYNNIDPGIENYHLLGNHDFSVDPSRLGDILETLSMPDFYYSYVRNGWRFIVLDATDVSYYSNPLHNYDNDIIDTYYKRIEGKQNHNDWNGAIGKEQQAWLNSELKKAELLDQTVILFSHMTLRPEHATNLWNSEEIIDLIENSPNVVAFISGHRHEGAYDYKNGIHYIGISGMLNTKINTYGILEIYHNKLILKGYGNLQEMSLDIDVEKSPGSP